MKIYECETQINDILKKYNWYKSTTSYLNSIIEDRLNQGGIKKQPDQRLCKSLADFLKKYTSEDPLFCNDPYITELLQSLAVKMRDYYGDLLNDLELPTRTDWEEKNVEKI